MKYRQQLFVMTTKRTLLLEGKQVLRPKITMATYERMLLEGEQEPWPKTTNWPSCLTNATTNKKKTLPS